MNCGIHQETIGYYFYFPPENKIVVARYAEFFEKLLINQEISGRAVDLEEIQEEDTTPSEITSNIPQEVEGFEPPQEEVIPIRSFKAAMLDSGYNKVESMHMKRKIHIHDGQYGMGLGRSSSWLQDRWE
ncbi:hypothetical protein Tco_1568878 [Tanacetum coccineum]